MIRRFVAKLDDEFAEIGFNDSDAGAFQRVVEMNFLARHCLGLDDGLRVFGGGNLQDNFPRLRRVAGPMHFRSARFNFRGELFEIFVQMIDGFPFYFGGQLACALPVLKRHLALVARQLVMAQRRADDLAMAQIARHHPGLLHKLGGIRAHRWLSTSARWMVFIGFP